jgi:molecular chaperone HtpG
LPTAGGGYGGKGFKSVTRANADLDKIKSVDEPAKDKPEEKAKEGELSSLIALMKLTLGDVVKDVRSSSRLTSSPVCLVADEGDIDIHLERFLKQHNQIRQASKRILELNPKHPLIRKMAEKAAASGAADELKDIAWLLFDQARLLDGEPLADPVEFGRRLSVVLGQMLAA